MTRLLIVMIVLGAAVVPARSQSAAATPDPQVSALQAQIELLQKQKEYEKLQSDIQEQRLKSLLDVTRNGAKPPENQTTYKPEERPSAEVSALSYDALNELSQQIVRQITAVTGRYSAIVVYNDNDFLTLAKYRLYRHQSDIALANYKKLKDDLAAAAGKAGVVDCDNAANSSDARCQGGRRGMWSLPEMGTKAAGGVSALQSLFAAPAIATSLTGSVADLMAMFRSETIITPSRDTVDQSSLATAMGSALLANNRDMKILVPAAFLPEYDLDVEGRESILMRVSDVNQAYADISDFLSNTGDLAPLEKKHLQDIINRAEALRATLQGLSIGAERIGGQTRGEVAQVPSAVQSTPSSSSAPYSDLRSLIRAEKIERFLRQGGKAIGDPNGPKVGILKVSPIASGGSRRETRNLIFGNKIRYSGALTFQVQVFDVDGTLRSSDVFSGYTGFRKFEPIKK